MSPEGAESWSLLAQRELFGGWRRWLSFALIWVWSCVAGILSGQEYVLGSLAPVLHFGNSVVLLFCVVALVVVLALGKRIAEACTSRRYTLVGWAFLVVGSVLILVSILAQSAPAFFVGAACGGVSIGILKVAWGEMYSMMPLKASMASMGYALIASSVVVLLVRFMPIEALGALLVVVSIPLGHCLYTGSLQLCEETRQQETLHVQGRMSPWVVAVPAIVGLSYGVFKAGAPLMAQTGPLFLFDIESAGLWANLLAGIALFAASRFLGGRITPQRIVVADMVVVVAGLLMLCAPHVSTGAATVVHELGFSLFYFFMIVYWGDFARRMRTPVILTYTIGYLSMMAAQLLGATVGAATGESYVAAGDMTLTYALVFAFVAAIAFFSGSSPLSRRPVAAEEDSAQKPADLTLLACEQLADKHALTPREREVLNVLARGRNAAHIADELVISQDTAKSHIKNIYRKLDVHTQQELLDLVGR